MRTLNLLKLIVLSTILAVFGSSFAETSTEKYNRELQAKYNRQTKEQERHDARMAAQAEKQLARDIANLKKGDRGLVGPNTICLSPEHCGERFLSISVSKNPNDITYCYLNLGKELELVAKLKDDVVARVVDATDSDCPHVVTSREDFVRLKRKHQVRENERAARNHDNDVALERIKAAREALDAAGR